MRKGTPPVESIERALKLLARLVEDGGATGLAALAAELNIPLASAHRIVASLARTGFVRSPRRGTHLAGPTLIKVKARIDENAILAAHARPIIERLGISTRATAHLGVFESEMVTYLIKAGQGSQQLFTEEGGQLEAYCSAVGKVLLAYLPEAERDAYLSTGPFIALTPATETDPKALRANLVQVRDDGFATDREEIAPGLFCLAVPVFDWEGRVRAAVSTSNYGTQACCPLEALPLLRCAANEIALRVFDAADPVERGAG